MKQESITLLQSNLDMLTRKHNELLIEGKYNDALNVMKNVEYIVRQLNELGVPIINQETETVEKECFDWYKILKMFIETQRSQLIELDYSSIEKENMHRSTGKTSALLKLSSEFKIPIIVHNYKKCEPILREKAKELKLNTTFVLDAKMLNLKQFENIKTVLIDEDTDLNKFYQLKSVVSNKTMIGFKRNNSKHN